MFIWKISLNFLENNWDATAFLDNMAGVFLWVSESLQSRFSIDHLWKAASLQVLDQNFDHR